MKKLLLSASLAVVCGGFASAELTTVATVFEGNQTVGWDNTLFIEADQFAEASVGDFIYITFSNTTDVIELKSDGDWIPGSRYSWLGEGTPDYRCYLTQAGLNAIQADGLELCGANFTVTSVQICNDGFVMPEGAIWGGYFWIDEWSTLELWKTAFAAYDGEKYMVINLSDDNGDYDNYVMQVMTTWDNPETVIGNADKGNEVKTPEMTVIDLSDVDLYDLLSTSDRVMIQGNKEEGNPFNITSVVLTNTNPLDESDDEPGNEPGEEPGVDGVASIQVLNGTVNVYNLQGVMVKAAVNNSEALSNLPKGIYIVKSANGIKKVVK